MALKRDKYDAVFSKLVRARANWCCEHPDCGKYFPLGPARRGLHCSHLFGRRRQSTRYDLDNAAALCYGHHQHFAEHPDKHHAFFLDRLGVEKYEALVKRANKTKKWKAGEKEALYRNLKRALELFDEPLRGRAS